MVVVGGIAHFPILPDIAAMLPVNVIAVLATGVSGSIRTSLHCVELRAPGVSEFGLLGGLPDGQVLNSFL